MRNEPDGTGTSVPPSKKQVLIYFSQKDAPVENACKFYEHFQKRKWKNDRKTKLSNWKIAAWNWILIHHDA